MGRVAGSTEARQVGDADQLCNRPNWLCEDCYARLTAGFGLIVALEARESGVQPATAAISAGIPTRLIARRRL